MDCVVAVLLLAPFFGHTGAALQDVRGNLGDDRILHVELPTTHQNGLEFRHLRHLLASGDVWGWSGDGFDIRVSKSGAEAFAPFNVSDQTAVVLQQFTAQLNDTAYVCGKGPKPCARASADVFYGSYQRLGAIHQRLDGLAAKSPELAKTFVLGQSYEGREQRAIRIARSSTGAQSGAPLPTIFYFCGEHAREWLPPMFCTWMAENLLANGGSELLASVQFVILPVMNPDGYEFSHTNNNLWRKSRKPNTGSACIGTDLNRNYGDHWCESGASKDACSDTFCGAAAFDNVETANVKKFAAAEVASGGRIFVETDVHAYGYMWMFPYGYTKELPTEPDYERMAANAEATALAIKGVHQKTFETGTIANVIYEASGSSCDWFYAVHGVAYAFAPEVRGTSFQPSTSEIVPSCEELYAGMLAQVRYALDHDRSASHAQAANSTIQCVGECGLRGDAPCSNGWPCIGGKCCPRHSETPWH